MREIARGLLARLCGGVACNICGWKGLHFRTDSWHWRVICPGCGSGVRHRLVIAALKGVEELSIPRIVAGRRVLHFAPEPFLSAILRRHAGAYDTADLAGAAADLSLDIQAMPSVGDGRYDVVLACDVLEHVPDDRRAAREIFRVLKPGGHAILTVPQKDDLAETLEDPEATTPEAQERRFGVPGHLRIYGDDFARRIAAAGFAVRAVDERSFPEAAVREHVLRPPRVSPRPLATNRRKVFFAQKPASPA